jgi:hypothetical protein
LQKQKDKEEKEIATLREPSEIFKDQAYAKFKIGQVDEKGIPTHKDDGEEFPKKIRGLFEKDYAKHVKARDELLLKKSKENKD